MFAPYCEAHGSRVLLPLSRIYGIERLDGCLLAHFECNCGQLGTWSPGLRTPLGTTV